MNFGELLRDSVNFVEEKRALREYQGCRWWGSGQSVDPDMGELFCELCRGKGCLKRTQVAGGGKAGKAWIQTWENWGSKLGVPHELQ